MSGSGGVTGALGAIIELRGATITDNVGPNVGLFVRSLARADAATVIGGATTDGIIVGAGGGMWFGAATKVQANAGWGVNCVGGANSEWGGNGTQVTGNGLGSFSPGCHPL